MNQARDEILELYEFNSWANRRILAAASKFSEAELSRDLKGSFPSILSTLLHIMSAQWIWLSRWEGRSPTTAPEEWHTSSFELLRSICQRVDQDFTTM